LADRKQWKLFVSVNFSSIYHRLIIIHLYLFIIVYIPLKSSFIFYRQLQDLSWNPQDNRQAEDRAHRLGQQQSVSVTYLTTAVPRRNDTKPQAELTAVPKAVEKNGDFMMKHRDLM
jgi:hypothetical protein